MRVHVAYASRRRERAFNSLVRYVSRELVRLDLAGLRARLRPPESGEPVVLIAREAGRLRAFDAEVIRTDVAPPALVLTPPVEARRPERRRFPRVAAEIPLLSVSWLSEDVPVPPLETARIIDISIGGMRLRGEVGPSPGTALDAELQLDPRHVTRVGGVVVGAERVPNSPAFDIRVAFNHIDPPAFAALAAYVDRSLEAAARTAGYGAALVDATNSSMASK